MTKNKSLKLHSEAGIMQDAVEQIFESALTYHASDIHLQPQETEVSVRFRIDGDLKEVTRIPKLNYEGIVNRIKILAKLRIDEHFSAQDGAIHYVTTTQDKVDFRVSVLPTLLGESVVFRILGTQVGGLTLKGLGLSDANQKLIMATAKKPFGMIINAGPAGAGKTTTLYAILKLLHRPEISIVTIEDPVEYKIQGIDQIQVNTQTNLTFAEGLRSIVRQDPNIILVGEIRDRKTAEIAVNASLTGHPLLTTFHSNDAATAIPRLMDMGVEPFLLASVLELLIAQRLVRRLCVHCRIKEQVDVAVLKKFLPPQPATKAKSQKITVYSAKGCRKCQKGYNGRTAIFELIPITKKMRELILTHPNTDQIWAVARQHGAQTLFEDGLEKVKQGTTSLEELIRIASEFE